MGMGEPLDNWPSVEARNTRSLTNGCTASGHAVTLSTVGPSAEKIKLKGLPCKLAWSIHATQDDQRRGLIPLNLRQDLRELIEAFETVVASLERTHFSRYTLIRDLNDSEEDAEGLRRRWRCALARKHGLTFSQ